MENNNNKKQNQESKEENLPSPPLSLLQKFKENVSNHSTKTALTFLKSNGSIHQSYTYKQLNDESTNLALWLSSNTTLQKGDRVMLVYPPGLEFILSFLACMKLSLISVPTYPPHPNKKESLLSFSKIVTNCNATFVLTSKSYTHFKKLENVKSLFKVAWPDGLKWIVTDGKNGAVGTLKEHDDEIHDIAFLQYTSGSTSDPKGVMITHSNLSHNLHIIIKELQADEDTIVVSWLPQYHDMGLIGSYLGILYCGGSGYYMSPISFLQRPMLWIETINQYRATHIQAPNFAYTLTARKFTDAALDLSCVKHMINGAEPINYSSIQLFYDTFCPYGLKHVMFPTYGLAEHTVFVCSGGKQVLHVDTDSLEVDGKVVIKEDGMVVVGCGYPFQHDIDLRIVNPETNIELQEDEVGEIWISSPSVALGYYNQPSITKLQFQATLENKQHYLRTGDLGFMHDKELFICGRKKDLIILNGRNYYPQDVEKTAEECLGIDVIRPGCTAIFESSSNNGDNTQIILLMELRNEKKSNDEYYMSLCNKLHSTIQQEHGIPVSHIILLQERSIPKTTSGKIARAWCRKAYLENTLKIIHQKSYVNDIPIDTDTNDTTEAITQQQEVTKKDTLTNEQIKNKLLSDISQIVNIPKQDIDIHASFISQFDSLSISQSKGMLESNYNVKLSDEYLFQEGANIDKLVEVVRLGYAPDDAGGSSLEIDGGGVASHRRKQRKDCGEMLGCPPGAVKCAIM